MTQINWLHLSDLRMGPKGSPILSASAREEFERDLRVLAPVVGPWDLLVVTGDLSETGAVGELDVVSGFLGSLLDDLESLGKRPRLVLVPGGHDARERRAPDHLPRWSDLHLRAEMRSPGPAREKLLAHSTSAFWPWLAFWQRWLAEAPPRLAQADAEVPGDAAYVLEKDGARVGILGLNSAYARLVGGRWEGLLDVDIRFAREAIEHGLGPDDPWIVLTHHTQPWLLPETARDLSKLLRDRRALHLAGHAHWPPIGGADKRLGVPTFLALSLLGVPGEPGTYGYAAGCFDFDAGSFRIWPRRFVDGPGDRLIVGAERDRFYLDPDESFTIRGTPTASGGRLQPLVDDTPPVSASAPPVTVATLPPPAGLTLRETLGAGLSPAVWLAWSPEGARLASGHVDGSIVVWDAVTGHELWSKTDHGSPVIDVAFSYDGRHLASISEDRLLVWPAGGGAPMRLDDGGWGIAFHPLLPKLTWRSKDNAVHTWDAKTGERTRISGELSYVVAYSPRGRLASLLMTGERLLAREKGGTRVATVLEAKRGFSLDLDWHPDEALLAAAYADGSVLVWDIPSGAAAPRITLAAHSDAVSCLAFSHDGRLLATKSHDGTVKLWRTDTWDMVATIAEATSRELYGGLAFSPVAPALATLGSWNIRLWDVDETALLRETVEAPTVHTARAKVVLVGEGNAGKSCLAMRLSEDRYADLGPTHGMRFWQMPVLSPAEAGDEREIILWDLGGQSEYQLVHQLFLGEAAVALLVFEPRRGRAALDEIEGWIKHLAKHEAARPTTKLLVGTKLDDALAPLDRAAIDDFVRRHGLAGYVGTSAREGIGTADLREGIARHVDWSALGKTSQSQLFHRIRRAIEAQMASGRVVLPLAELEYGMRAEDPGSADPEAVRAVVRQLALQGSLSDSRLADGTRALVLQIDQIDRYAGSLVVMARDNPRGVPAIDLAALMSPSLRLPRMADRDRLRRDQELPILDCVTELLLLHGIAFRHEGLLVFPSLFRATERDATFSHAVALSYEFSGAVDNIYASLVTTLALSRQFGPVRLWEDRAELSRAGHGTAGVRRSQMGSARGTARLDVYFDAEAGEGTRELFVGFVEEHLAERGVEILERLTMICACGFELPEKAVRARMDRGLSDIVCSMCDARLPLTFGAADAREKSPDLAQRIRALRTTAADEKRQTMTGTKVQMSHLQRTQEAPERPIRILHLSDLHVTADADPIALLQPLAMDLEDSVDGLGVDALDLLVISGDVTNRASSAELEKARELVSGIVDRFRLTAERCVLVPGNHDLDWNEPVYEMVKKRAADPKRLVPGRFKEQGDYYEIRDDAKYPGRFKGFSQYFYHPLLQQPYPLAPEEQCIPILAADLGIQILALNSAWEIDEYFPARSGIHPGALARGLARADDQVRRAREGGRLGASAGLLRLAVWHHPVSGNEKIQDDAFMGNLQRAGVRICLHGHVHEDRADHLGYLHPTRSVHVVGAGSFGAPAHDRPESIPRLYNLVEVSRDLATVRVHTRALRAGGGAWEGWAVWPSARPGERRASYDVTLGAGPLPA